MKKTILAFGLLITMSSYADIEYSPSEPPKATAQEVARNRACFEELNVQGCGDPAEDIQQFKSCLKDIKVRLSSDCKKMMNDLYGNH